MERITINNYQYWYNPETNKVYLDESGIVEITKRFFTAQEQAQLHNEVKKLHS